MAPERTHTDRLPLAAGTLGAERPPASPPRRRSRAKPRPPRPRAVVLAELKGLGGLVLEQALLDADAQPLESLLEWSNRIAGELAVEGVGSPATYRELLRAIVGISRRAEAQGLDGGTAAA